jgi:hypothetical protein
MKEDLWMSVKIWQMYSNTWNCVEPFVKSHCYVPNKPAGVGLSKHIMFVTTPDMAGCIEINCGRHFSEFLQNTWTHYSTSSLSNSIAKRCFMYMFHSSYESNLCGGFIPATFQAFFNRRNQGGSHKAGQAEGHSEPAHTSTPSSGCMLLLGCGWTSTELIFCFTLATKSVRNRSHI